MNYRHAYHAGNFADCFKHAILVWLLRALVQKEKPFFVLDTHAGAGKYDLQADQAQRTGEAQAGIVRLLENPPPALADFTALMRQLGLYPGSPAIIRAMLRPGDRAAACELHPEDHAALRRHFARDAQMAVHLRDGFEAIRAFLPPTERRGLTLIDPPYEAPDEFSRVAEALRTAQSRFPGGVAAAWYLLKPRAPVRAFQEQLHAAALRDMVAAEIFLREPTDPSRLNGCGMILLNPPFRFDAELPLVLEALLARLGNREPGEGVALIRLADE